MAEKGDERQHTNPSLQETLASTGGAHRRKEPDPLSWNRSRRMSSPGSSSRSSTSHGGDLRQLLNRGINWIEESLSPLHCIQDSFYYECFCKFHLRYFRRNREPDCDLRRVSWSNGKKQAATNPRCSTLCSGREAFRLDWGERGESSAGRLTYHPVSTDSHLNYHNRAERNPGNERPSDSLKEDSAGHLLPNRGSNNWSGECSAFRSRDIHLSIEDKRKRTGRDSSRPPVHKWRKTGPHPDRSRRSERSVSPERRPRNAGWCHGRSRGSGSPDLSHLSRSPQMSPTDTKKTKDEREKKLGFSSPKQTLKQTMSAERGQSDAGQPMPEKREEKKQPNPRVRGNLAPTQRVPSQNNDGQGWSINNDEQRKSDGLGTSTVQPDPQLSTSSSWTSSGKMKRWGPASPNVDGSRYRTLSQWSKAAQESDGWGQNYSPIRKSQSRSLTRSSQAAVGTNNDNKESNLSPYLGLKYPYFYSPLVSTSCSGGTDADMQPISSPYAIVGTELPRLFAVNPVSPAVNADMQPLSSPYRTLSQWSKAAQESDGRGQNYSPIKKSQSSSLTRSPQAAVSTNNNNKESNLSPYLGLKYPYFYSPLVSTSCSGGTDADMQPISSPYAIVGTELPRLFAVNPVSPTVNADMQPISSPYRTLSQWSKAAQESDGWGQNYSPIKKSQSSSLTRSPQAAVSTNNNNKESNLSPYLGLKYPYFYSPLVSTSCSGGTDADMQPISAPYAIVGTELPRLFAVNPVSPTPEVPNLGPSQPNQNLVVATGTAAVERIDAIDKDSLRWALRGFAQPKLIPLWAKKHLDFANYQQILSKFVDNVTQSLGTFAPKTREDSCKFVKKENDSLNKCLQMYLGRFVTKDVMMNI